MQFRKCLVNWIICSNQLFTEVENNEFRNVLYLLNHDTLSPTADMIKTDMMEIFSVKWNNIHQLLQVWKFLLSYIFTINVLFFNIVL